MLKYLSPPTFPDLEKTLTARAVHTILVSLMVAVLLLFVIMTVVPDYAERWLTIIFAVYALCLPLLIVLRVKGHVVGVSVGLIVGLWAIVTVSILTGGGLRAPIHTAYLVIIFVAGLILGGRAGVAAGVVCVVCLAGFALLEEADLLPAGAIPYNPLFYLSAATIFIVIIVSLQNFASLTIKDSLRRIRKELGEKQEAREAARLEQELTARIMEASPVGITYVDPQGRIAFANRRAEEILGDLPPDIENQQGSAFPGNTLAVQEVLKSRRRVQDREHAIELPDGGRVLLSVNASPILGKDGTMDGIVAVFEDVTEARRLEEELQGTLSQLRDLSHRLEDVREEEQTRIAREIHDDLGQTLTALKIDLEWVRHHVPSTESQISGRLQGMSGLIDTTIESVQKIATELRLSILHDLGLVAALEWRAADFQSKTGIRCVCTATSELPDLPIEAANAAFRICQEALTNIVRHAGAKNVEIKVLHQQDDVVVEVLDDGRGITTAEIMSRKSIGLLGMKERARALGGNVRISGMKKGTRIHVTIPLDRQSRVRTA